MFRVVVSLLLHFSLSLSLFYLSVSLSLSHSLTLSLWLEERESERRDTEIIYGRSVGDKKEYARERESYTSNSTISERERQLYLFLSLSLSLSVYTLTLSPTQQERERERGTGMLCMVVDRCSVDCAERSHGEWSAASGLLRVHYVYEHHITHTHVVRSRQQTRS
jgi:hypothetical protein